MIEKSASPESSGFFRKSLRTIFVVEIAAFFGSYVVWSQLNRDQGNFEIFKPSVVVLGPLSRLSLFNREV